MLLKAQRRDKSQYRRIDIAHDDSTAGVEHSLQATRVVGRHETPVESETVRLGAEILIAATAGRALPRMIHAMHLGGAPDGPSALALSAML